MSGHQLRKGNFGGGSDPHTGWSQRPFFNVKIIKTHKQDDGVSYLEAHQPYNVTLKCMQMGFR